jgi:hypothetical protein
LDVILFSQDAKEKFHRMEREKLDELQTRLERRRQETAAANVAAAVTSTREAAEARGQFRAVPARHLSSDDELDALDDEDDDGFEPVSLSHPLHHQHHHQQQHKGHRFEADEQQRRRTSHQLASEFKRKTHQQHHAPPQPQPAGYQELAEQERYPGLDKQTARLSHHFQERYRHSYAEPDFFSRQQALRRYAPNNGPPIASSRLAGIHPY